MAVGSDWRGTPVHWFERWTSEPLGAQHLEAVRLFLTHQEANDLCARFDREVRVRVAGYPEIEWGRLSGRGLLGSMLVGVKVAKHLQSGFGEHLSTELTLPDRRSLYIGMLLALGACETGYFEESAMDLALAAIGCEQALPWLDAEWRKRCRRHRPSMGAALLIMSKYVNRPGAQLLAALRPLARSVIRQVGKTGLERPTIDEATSQLAETVLARYGNLPPLIALARALDDARETSFDVVVTAAANDITDPFRGLFSRAKEWDVPPRDLFVTFTPDSGTEPIGWGSEEAEERSRRVPEPTHHSGQLAAVEALETIEKLRSDPRLAPLVDVIERYGKLTDREAARRLGKSVKTVSRLRAESRNRKPK